MPMDAAVFAALADEFARELREARLERITATNPRELVFLFRPSPSGGARSAVTLTLSLDGPLARLHLGGAQPRLADQPPFVLLLRRHLLGCRLAGVRHPAWERLLYLDFLGPADELPRRRLTLVYELLGPQANLLLLDARGVLLGSLRPLPPEDRNARLVLGAAYASPPPPTARPGAPLPYLLQAVRLALPTAPLRSVLVRNVGGLGPWAAGALARSAGLDPDTPAGDVPPEGISRLHSQLDTFARAVEEGRFVPVLWRESGRPCEFWVYPAPTPPGWVAEPQPSASQAVALFFTERVQAARLAQARHALVQRLDAQAARLERRLKAQQADLARAEEAEAHRRSGDLILANLPRLTRGMSSFTGCSYADPSPLTVPLDPRLTPSENAQRYFDRYRKAKRGLAAATVRVAATAALLGQTRLARLEAADAETHAEVEALAAELETEGVLEGTTRDGRAPAGRRPEKGGPAVRPGPRRYRSSDGHEILAGRNSRENDWLTLHSGAPHDLWLHVKELAGAHVILRLSGEDPAPEEALREAAQVAAWHSEGRESSQVPVDYTLRRHVRKAPGGRPGQVLYDHHRTLYVTPDPALVARLRVPVRDAEPRS